MKMNVAHSLMFFSVALIKVRVDGTTTQSNSASGSDIQCGNLSCSYNAKCKDDGSGGLKCQCHTGYQGQTCHADFDECSLGNPCMHRGICHNTVGSFWCECLDGWSGLASHCEGKESTLRKCEPGWMGEWCQDQCLNSSTCARNEVCQKRGRGLRCICAPGWHGVNCTTDVDECTRNPCPNTATCLNSPGSYKCPCLPGWTGVTCDEDIDECQMVPCLNKGTCTNNNGSYSCRCPPGWQGFDCHECTSGPCNCTGGWTGVHCSDDLDECLIVQCLNNGTCLNTPGSYQCACAKGWKGSDCTQDLDECLNKPCLNSGTCFNTPGSYKCMCPSGWEDPDCKYDIDECRVGHCLNSGTCINTVGSFKCECLAGWEGENCNSEMYEWQMESGQIRIIVGSVICTVLMLFSIGVILGIIKYKWCSGNKDDDNEVKVIHDQDQTPEW